MIAAQHNRPRNGMELSFRNLSLYCLEFLAFRSRREHIARPECHASKNLDNLLGSLACRIDHLRHADAQRAVMVDFREAQILKRKMTQASDRLFGLKKGIEDLLEQLAECALVHCSGDV